MARASRSTTDHLSYLKAAADMVERITPFALLRGAEARASGLPRIGAARLPVDDVVALVHAPSLAFPAATIGSITIGNGTPVVEGNWLGLTGPMGPLPLHLTEHAAQERRYGRRQPFGRFLDLIAGRMLQLFYRAWAVAVPAASADRVDDDSFGNWIASLTGASDGAPRETVFPVAARIGYASLFASPRSPSGIADALSDLVRLPVTVVENVERWRDVEVAQRSMLARGFSTLGMEALAGRRVCTAEDAFKVVVHVDRAADLADVLPGGARHSLLVEGLKAFSPPHLEWNVELAVRAAAIRPARLDASAPLGWSSWIGRIQPDRTRSDARFGARAWQLAQRPLQEIPA